MSKTSSVSPKSTEAFGDSPYGKISIYNQCFYNYHDFSTNETQLL